ncbi:metallophosphoesterase [Candidatus Woesearchaeota archaeon]|nr:metallophosphoesterase [Candidatus Woesearchaeota archaeon]
MELMRGLRIVDLALQYKDYLIIGDLQLGYEQALQRKGVLVPKFQFHDIRERLAKIFKKVKVKKLIINGDIKHEFGIISEQEWREILQFFDFCLQHVTEIILVKGNHDLVIAPVARKRNIHVVDFYRVDDVLIFHGHKLLREKAKILVIGHEHPAVSFRERQGEKFKCFLVGKWKQCMLLVMPSFNPLTEGSDITKERFLSPYLKEGVEDFSVYVVEDTVYSFGKVKDLL